MNELQIFESSEFGRIRTTSIDGEPYFCGKDVAEALGYTNPRDAVIRHCRGVVKRDTPTVSGTQEMSFIPESDVYRLVFRSKLPEAERFTDWVTSVILPSIRKTGGYLTGQEELSGPELMAKALEWAQAAIKEKDARIAEMRPKELFADSVTASKDSILIGELAKMIAQNGVPIGQNRLFRWMREHKYLMSGNIPTQRAMEMGLFEICERTITDPEGRVRIITTTRVTGKGQNYFVNKFLNERRERAECSAS